MNALRPVAALSLLALLALPLAAQSLSNDRDQPIEINADQAEHSDQDGVTHWRGNFSMVQGSLRVTADRATVYQRDNEVERILLHGTPATLRQQLDGDAGSTEAEAQQIDYLRGRDTVLLTGSVEVRQPRGTLRSESMTYDIGSGRLTGGGTEGGRVQMRIEPRRSTPAP